jgi:hypothetical protein
MRDSSVRTVRTAAFITVVGVAWNRLNTAIFCFNYQLYQDVPYWKEIWLTVTLYVLYFIFYRFIVYRLPIVFDWEESSVRE